LDKFGIFKLLNTLFTPTGENSNTQNAVGDALNSLLNSVKNPPKEQPTSKTHTPLQSSMLTTMRSHDDFVKRVKENQNKGKT